jgi:membrane associated rhomboid family serine protease
LQGLGGETAVRAPPPSDAYRLLFTPPPVVSWLLASFVAVLGLMLILQPLNMLDRFLGRFAFIPLTLTNAPWATGLSAGQYFEVLIPLVSFSFLNGGLLHLLMNGLGFLIVGTIAARRMGDTSFLLFCIITGVLAGLTHWAFYMNSGTPLVGASGMLSGLVGATSRFVMLDLRRVGPCRRIDASDGPSFCDFHADLAGAQLCLGFGRRRSRSRSIDRLGSAYGRLFRRRTFISTVRLAGAVPDTGHGRLRGNSLSATAAGIAPRIQAPHVMVELPPQGIIEP